MFCIIHQILDQPPARKFNKHFITFPIEINVNSISMENAETKIKRQKQQFLSKVLLGLMTFFLLKKSFQKQSALQTV